MRIERLNDHSIAGVFVRMRHQGLRIWLLLALLFAPIACGDESIGPDTSISALVGSWDAIKMVVVNQADPSTAPNLILEGVTFFVDIQPSGQYTAIQTAFGLTSTEFGRLEVSDNRLTLHREQPGPPRSDQGTYSIRGDTLSLSATTEFDFNRDGSDEPAQLLVDFKKRP